MVMIFANGDDTSASSRPKPLCTNGYSYNGGGGDEITVLTDTYTPWFILSWADSFRPTAFETKNNQRNYPNNR